MAEGRILSIESMGLVDGPGIRTVVFFKGCPLRCKFCHNPDSWCGESGETVTADELIAKILRFRPYFERSGGGVTFSGGEPLLQKEFLLEMLRKCKENNIHTCLDTSGAGVGDYEEILSLCDLVLYDVKATEPGLYEDICGKDMSETLKFTDVLRRMKVETIVRQVVIPGITDSDEYMIKLGEYIKKHIPHARSVALLPYHRMGEHKYESLGLKAPFAHIPAMDKEKTDQLKQRFFGMKGE